MSQVLHIERADGCRPEIKALLELWKQHGTFDIYVAEDGGYRFGPAAEAVQANFFKIGMSKARTLAETPHGRRCAVDCHPVGFNPHRDFKDPSNAGMLEKFKAWVAFVELYGKELSIISGGHFSGFGAGGADVPHGDMPHAELKDWYKRFKFPSGEPAAIAIG